MVVDFTENIGGVVGEILAKKYGGLFRHNESAVVLSGVASQEVVRPNPERVNLSIINFGPQQALIAPGANFIAASQGIVLAPVGGFMLLNVDDDFILPILGWTGGSQAATTLYVLEVIRDVEGFFDEFA